jgi:mycoredoxin
VCRPGCAVETSARPIGNIEDRPDVVRAVTATAPELTMYSTTWCGYCRRLKTQLKEAGISYVEVDIEQDQEAADFVGSVNGGNHVVPTVKFADGSTATNPSLAAVKQAISALA